MFELWWQWAIDTETVSCYLKPSFTIYPPPPHTHTQKKTRHIYHGKGVFLTNYAIMSRVLSALNDIVVGDFLKKRGDSPNPPS